MPSSTIQRPVGLTQRTALRGTGPSALGAARPGLRLTVGRSCVLPGAVGRVFVESCLSFRPEAAVYAVRSAQQGALAVKIFDLAFISRSAVSRSFALQRRCRGHQVIAALHLHTTRRFAYLTMERPKGVSLDSYLSATQSHGERINLRLLLQQFAAMAHATDLCHQRGVVHRDLKPGNFVVPLSRPESPKLLDFALAHDQQQPTGTHAGTTTYMAPELLRGAAANTASDVWALGIALFTMVVGIEPHYADDEALVAAQVLSAQAAFTPDDLALFVAAHGAPNTVEAGIVDLYQAATQVDPAARPGAQALALVARRLAAMLPSSSNLLP